MCDYFILSKPKGNILQDTDQIVSVTGKVYILPKNNIVWYIERGLFENSLIDWCAQFCSKDKNMLDIGAHSGTYTVSLAEYCKHVYAFEPQRMTYYALCGSVALTHLTNVDCINVGLGSLEQVGKQRLNICSLDGGGSSLHTPSELSEEIEIKTLDSFQLDNIGFIKMDVEDNEHQVLLASVETLQRSNYPPILFEMNTHRPELLSFLESFTYKILVIQEYPNMFLATR
jgi:FkbM family methyltransferase